MCTCPCALVLSVPLSYFNGIGGASSKGILVKGGVALDMLQNVIHLSLIKLVLTKGNLAVSRVIANGISGERLWNMQLMLNHIHHTQLPRNY